MGRLPSPAWMRSCLWRSCPQAAQQRIEGLRWDQSGDGPKSSQDFVLVCLARLTVRPDVKPVAKKFATESRTEDGAARDSLVKLRVDSKAKN